MSYWKHNIKGIDWATYPLWEREAIFSHICNENNVELEQGNYAILWEDPEQLDMPAKVTYPSPRWLAMAMHGHILPPVEVYWALAADESQEDFKRHSRGALLHDTTPMNPMTEEEAMEYLIMKDIPPRVWRDYKGNRIIVRVVRREEIPTDRSNRNEWRIPQEGIEYE